MGLVISRSILAVVAPHLSGSPPGELQTSVLLIVAGAIVLGILLAFRPRPGRGEGVGNRPFELRKGDVVFLPAGVYRVANAAPLQEVLVTVTADGPNGRSLVVEKARIERIVGSSGGAPRNRISS